MSEKAIIECDECGQRVRVPLSMTGLEVGCPACDATFLIDVSERDLLPSVETPGNGIESAVDDSKAKNAGEPVQAKCNAASVGESTPDLRRAKSTKRREVKPAARKLIRRAWRHAKYRRQKHRRNFYVNRRQNSSERSSNSHRSTDDKVILGILTLMLCVVLAYLPSVAIWPVTESEQMASDAGKNSETENHAVESPPLTNGDKVRAFFKSSRGREERDKQLSQFIDRAALPDDVNAEEYEFDPDRPVVNNLMRMIPDVMKDAHETINEAGNERLMSIEDFEDLPSLDNAQGPMEPVVPFE